ncbi:hypothetical protein VB797_29610, partial [Rivularia sp. UHCC 0363]|nr:hypothetical protein [Rivularia sp. UHCC 0363]
TYTGVTYLYGGKGNDSLIGGSGNDVFKGGEGDDLIDGGAGNDGLYGEAGKDIFVIGTGRDTIYDFENDVDKLSLSGGFTFNDLDLKVSGNNTNILQDNQILVTLIGVDISLIDQNDFTSV